MAKKNQMPVDSNGNAIQAMKLDTAVDIDGTLASAATAALSGGMVRIVATDNDIRFLIGTDPTALATSHFLPLGGEIWMPIDTGDKVAVIGGIANIAVAGV